MAPDWVLALREEWAQELDGMEPTKKTKLEDTAAQETKAAPPIEGMSSTNHHVQHLSCVSSADWNFLEADKEEEPESRNLRIGKEQAKFLSAFNSVDKTSRSSIQKSPRPVRCLAIHRYIWCPFERLQPHSPKRGPDNVLRRIRAGTGSFTEESKARTVSGSTPTLKDKFVSFMAGEDDISRHNRVRMRAYKHELQNELTATSSAWKHHLSHKADLEQDYLDRKSVV